MRSEHHTGMRIFVLCVVVALALSMTGVLFAGVASAQEQQTGANASVEHDFDGADIEIVNTEWNDGTLAVTYDVGEGTGVSMTDAGTVQSAEGDSYTDTPYQEFYLEPGVHTVEFNYLNEERVTIGAGEDLVTVTGDVDEGGLLGLIPFIYDSPSVLLVRLSGIGAAIGTLFATGLSVGVLKRRHHNTYRELFSEERVRVEEDRVDGILGKITQFAHRFKYVLAAGSVVLMYTALARFGFVPGVGDVWMSLSGAQRLVTASVIASMLIMFVPAFVVVQKLWEPAKEFIVSFDVADSLSVTSGSQGGIEEFLDDVREDGEFDVEELVEGDDQIAISVYSGSPDRISQLEVVEGEPDDVRSPGGQTYITRNFDAQSNKARGTWPGTAHDAIIAAAYSAIQWNREVLQDESDAFRTLLGGVGAMRSASNSSAAVALNKELAQSTDIDPGPMNGILDRALDSTRYGGFFTDDEDDGEDEEYPNDVNSRSNDGGDGSGSDGSVNDTDSDGGEE